MVRVQALGLFGLAVAAHSCRVDPSRRIVDDARYPIEAGKPPPKELPPDLLDAFTRCGTAEVFDFYVDDTMGGQGLHVKFREEAFARHVESARGLIDRADEDAGSKSGPSRYLKAMPGAIGHATAAMRKYREAFRGARVAVFGSQQPTYETIALALGAASVTVFEYQTPVYEHELVDVADARDLNAAAAAAGGWPSPGEGDAARGAAWLRGGGLFDVALSISSFDHDGLGRYGDALSPDGDLRAMDTARAAVRPGGLLLVSVPVGPDAVAFNLMRRYGRARLPLLLEGWEEDGRVGWDEARLDADVNIRRSFEPVFALRKPVADGAGTDWAAEMRRPAGERRGGEL